MRRLDAADWERLSRLRSDDLPGDEELVASGELSAALETLDAIDEAATRLPCSLEPTVADAIVARVMEGDARPARRWRWWIAGVAAAAASAMFVSRLPQRVDEGWLLLGREGSVEGAVARSLPPGTRLQAGTDSAALLAMPRGTVIVGQHTGVRLDRGVDFEAGTIAVQGERLTIRAGDTEVMLDGTGLVSTEPLAALVRATRDTHFEGSTMGFWKKIGPPAVGAMAGSAATLLLLQGSAQVSEKDAPPIPVVAGDALELGTRDAVPRRVEAEPPLLASAKRRAQASVADAGDPSSQDREALVAEVGRLRQDREDLLAEKARLASRLASLEGKERPRGTYARIPREDLLAAVEKGSVRIRLPHVFSGSDDLWHERAASDNRLTPDEEAALRKVYADSSQRIHEQLVSLYAQIGGDAASAMEMSAHSLFSEIQSKSLPGELQRAIHVAASERAGLIEVGTSGSALVRTFRMLWQEDDRVVAEVEQILGAGRGASFLDHEAWQHSDWEFGAGSK